MFCSLSRPIVVAGALLSLAIAEASAQTAIDPFL
jgi:hypothetical protein